MLKSLLVAAAAVGMVIASGVASADCTADIDQLQKQLSSSDAGMGPTGTGQVAETGNLHPPTETMNEAARGKATSSDDVASQNVGEPTDADAAQAGDFGTAAAPMEADASLARARQFDQAGDETACLDEIGKAKAHLGLQ